MVTSVQVMILDEQGKVIVEARDLAGNVGRAEISK
jgi:hypothetical protein